MRVDLHTHSSISDGTDTPAELVAAAVTAGLDVVALCDHDTFDGLAEATVAAGRLGVRLLRGIEMSADHEGASVHLLGYGCRVEDEQLAAELFRIRAGRIERIPTMVRRLADAGMPIDDVLAYFVAEPGSVGRPHIADAMVAKGYVADRGEAFARFLDDGGPIFVPRYAPGLAKALELLRGAGGATVIAHPWGRGSRDQLSASLLAELAASGDLDGVEVDHQDHDEATRAELRALAEDLGLLATGSSDYHGTGKVDHDLGCNLTDPAVLSELTFRVADRGGCCEC